MDEYIELPIYKFLFKVILRVRSDPDPWNPQSDVYIILYIFSIKDENSKEIESGNPHLLMKNIKVKTQKAGILRHLTLFDAVSPFTFSPAHSFFIFPPAVISPTYNLYKNAKIFGD